MKRPKKPSTKIAGRAPKLSRSPNMLAQPLAKGTVILLTAIVTASLFVRVYNLDGQSLDCEESYTLPAATGHHYVYFDRASRFIPTQEAVSVREYKTLVTPESGKGLREVTDVLSRNVHQPAYFFLMHYWIKLFGNSEWTLRLPSAIFGTLAVLAMFLLGKELFNPAVGLISALLLGMMPEQIFYSQEARMYPLLVLLVVTSTYAMMLTKKNITAKRSYIFYFIVSVIGIYTHYVYLYCFAFQTAFIWFDPSFGRTRTRQWLITQGGVLVAFLPWLLVSWAQKRTSAQVLAWVHGAPPSGSVLREIITQITRLIAVPEIPLGWLSVILAYGLLVLGIVLLRSDRSTLLLLGLWVFLPITGIVVMDTFLGAHAVSITRYWLVITPALYLLMAVGVKMIVDARPIAWGRPLQVLFVLTLTTLLCAAAMATTSGQLRRKPDEHKELAHFVESQVQNFRRGLVLTENSNALSILLGYYGQLEMDILQFSWPLDNRKKERLRGLLQNRENVLLLYSNHSNAQRVLLEFGYRPNGATRRFGHMFAASYAQPQSTKANSSSLIGGTDPVR